MDYYSASRVVHKNGQTWVDIADPNLQKITNLLELSPGYECNAVNIAVGILRERAEKTYVSVLMRTIEQDRSYGLKTRAKAFRKTVDEVVAFGIGQNGYVVQNMFEDMQKTISEPDQLLMKMNDPAFNAFYDYFMARGAGIDDAYKTHYRRAYCRDAVLTQD